MNLRILPSVAKGVVNAPPSKSVAHRALICASLADGVSVIDNIGTNDDIIATVSCLREIGASIDVDDDTATVKGIGAFKKKNEGFLFCNESGSTLRFLIPISLLFFNTAYFSGKGRLMERPQSVYEALFKEKGCFLRKDENRLVSGGELKSGEYRLPGNVSSQFISGLLFALPLLEGDSKIVLTTKPESAPYIDITISVMGFFGVNVEKAEDGYLIKGSRQYKPNYMICEGDWSNSAFLDALSLCDGDVTVKGLLENSLQGDKIYREFFEKIKEGYCHIDISQCPDLGPILMTYALLHKGARLSGTNRLKIKESDRGLAMAQELKKFGAEVEIGDDYIIVPQCDLSTATEPLDCHNDHRIAMSLAVLCSRVGGMLMGAECVNKSYPDFFKDIKNLGIEYIVE